MTDLLRLIRAHNLGIAAAGVLAGGWIALGAVAVPKLLAFAALSAIGLGAAGNAANDLQDAALDRLNRQAERPIASGRMRVESAATVIWVGGLLGLGSAALVSGPQVAVAAAVLVVMLSYSPWLKRHGVPGNLAVAVVAGLPLFYGGMAVGDPPAGVIPWLLAAWLHLAREIVKDLEDEPGDRAAGRRTLPVRYGAPVARRVVILVCVTFAPACVLLPLMAGYRFAYFLGAMLALGLVWQAVRWLTRGRLGAASLFLKGSMLAGLVALVLGRVT